MLVLIVLLVVLLVVGVYSMSSSYADYPEEEVSKPKKGDSCEPMMKYPNADSYEYDGNNDCTVKSCKSGYHMNGGVCVADAEPADCENSDEGNRCVEASCADCKAGKRCKNPGDCCGDLTCNSGFCTLIVGSGARDTDLSGIHGMDL
jgi:hypothetical protein